MTEGYHMPRYTALSRVQQCFALCLHLKHSLQRDICTSGAVLRHSMAPSFKDAVPIAKDSTVISSRVSP